MRAKDHDRLDGTRTATDAASLGVRSIVVPYAALAALWIVLSDWLVSQLVADPHGIAAAGTVKGLLFVTLTTVLLYALVRHFARAISAARSAAGTMTSAEALERIAVASPGAIGILRMRPDGSVSFPFASRGIEDIYGVPAERLARDATAAWAAIHPADTARLDEETRESARTLKPQHSEFRVLHPAKGEIWVSIHATPERTADGGTQWLGTANDITESKRVEEALRRSEERMRLAMGAAPLGTWDWDLASGTIDWSDNLWQMFGLERGSEALKIDAVLRTIHRDDRERVQQAIDRALAGDAASRIEMRFVKPDGSIRWALSHGRVIRDDAGKPIRMVGVDLDITEIKAKQAALDEARQHIESLAAQVLTVQEEERARLSRELHDEIGQSVTALKLLLDSALRRDAGRATSGQITAALRIAEELIEQTRELSRRLRPPQLDDLGLAAALRWHLARLSAPGSLRIEFEDRIGDARFPPAVELACFRIVQESLSNVLRHARASTVGVSLVQQSGRLELSVRDDGVGFPAEELLAQTGNSGSLGLLGMRERVAAAGGTFLIRSTECAGTEVYASFPLPAEP
jgi:two-component system sensor histidine kinase UhpB